MKRQNTSLFVEEAVIKQQQSKWGLSSKSKEQDKGLRIIHLCNGIRRYDVIECDSMIQKGLENTVKDYDVALDLELDSINKLLTQCLTFYQVTRNTIMDGIDFYITETFGAGASNYEGGPL
ncbi:uncharacterized protein LOC131598422 [Vicia villosa]|uniref:uncharacterized protein LOC131598422 n=1 Tax=Vicia villosa TaxID=3911 RepID=UPI00273B31CB|nr:uncharacterized protein LOC131598422 [Vicia villosa]